MSGAEYNMPDIIQNPLDASPALAPPSEGGYWTGNAHPSHMVSLASVLKSGADVIDEIHFAQDNTLSGSLHDIFLGHQLSTGSNGDIGQKIPSAHSRKERSCTLRYSARATQTLLSARQRGGRKSRRMPSSPSLTTTRRMTFLRRPMAYWLTRGRILLSRVMKPSRILSSRVTSKFLFRCNQNTCM